MLAAEFQTLSFVHLLTIAVCVGMGTATPVLVRRGDERRSLLIRRLVGWGCLAAWVMNTTYWMMPVRFELSGSLPLHFCNVANIFGALAVLRRMRLFQGVIYFWSGLYLWAFLTPTVADGPDRPGFWVFWIYHLFIALSFVHIVFIDRFRPAFRDLLHASVFTLVYVAFLAVVDALTGWNYGFVGDDVPTNPTPVDVLGDYPLRILWMVLLGAVVFLLLWLPFCRKPRR